MKNGKVRSWSTMKNSTLADRQTDSHAAAGSSSDNHTDGHADSQTKLLRRKTFIFLARANKTIENPVNGKWQSHWETVPRSWPRLDHRRALLFFCAVGQLPRTKKSRVRHFPDGLIFIAAVGPSLEGNRFIIAPLDTLWIGPPLVFSERRSVHFWQILFWVIKSPN